MVNDTTWFVSQFRIDSRKFSMEGYKVRSASVATLINRYLSGFPGAQGASAIVYPDVTRSHIELIELYSTHNPWDNPVLAPIAVFRWNGKQFYPYLPTYKSQATPSIMATVKDLSSQAEKLTEGFHALAVAITKAYLLENKEQPVVEEEVERTPVQELLYYAVLGMRSGIVQRDCPPVVERTANTSAHALVTAILDGRGRIGCVPMTKDGQDIWCPTLGEL